MRARYQGAILRARAASARIQSRAAVDAHASPVSVSTTAGRCEWKEVNIDGLLAARPG
jgi:hypothetical protein